MSAYKSNRDIARAGAAAKACTHSNISRTTRLKARGKNRCERRDQARGASTRQQCATPPSHVTPCISSPLGDNASKLGSVRRWPLVSAYPSGGCNVVTMAPFPELITQTVPSRCARKMFSPDARIDPQSMNTFVAPSPSTTKRLISTPSSASNMTILIGESGAAYVVPLTSSAHEHVATRFRRSDATPAINVCRPGSRRDCHTISPRRSPLLNIFTHTTLFASAATA
mmetsp:Transcript_1285/g.4658  ORF Transcript_1285/g.4658 Transcript_1285/m.4658 type:complete len:227 (+) Transcript_1285:1307-1987(+)